jgi:uncharacterized protein
VPSEQGVGVAVAAHPDGATVALRVVPRARRTELAGRYGDRLKLKVAAPPVEGAANAEVADFLAARCGVRSSDVELLAGHRGRDKVVLVRGVSAPSLVAALS